MSAAMLVQTLNAIQALFTWLVGRGLTRDRIQELLNLVHDEKRDITPEEAQAEIDALNAELDETETLINSE